MSLVDASERLVALPKDESLAEGDFFQRPVRPRLRQRLQHGGEVPGARDDDLAEEAVVRQ